VKRLIINADDFGLTSGVNRAVVSLHASRVLTSTTLMAMAAEFESAAASALPQPSLGVGCHIVLVDGTPCLPAGKITTLIDPKAPADHARFRPTLAGFVRDLLLGRIREADIEAEALAQVERVQLSGLRLTHVDTHKHTHMFARVLRPVLRAAKLAGVGAIRNPFEPAWSQEATSGAGLLRRIQVRALATQVKGFLSATERHRIATTDGALGVLATGTLDAPTLHRLLDAMPDGTWELVTHPGYHDGALEAANTRLRESREVEREALLAVVPAAVARNRDLELINFGQVNCASRHAVGWHARDHLD
jgi:predicted glycoside hydrolase/deacetylase ChbG (UPF0249 family)